MKLSLGALFSVLAMTASAPSVAHPLGNLGISHHSDLRIGAERIDIYYTLDFAEIPTFQETLKNGVVSTPGHASLTAYLERLGETLRQGLKLTLNARPSPLQRHRPCGAQFSDGAAGMQTMRVTCEFSSALPVANHPITLRYVDGNFTQRTGWKEIILNAHPAIIVSSQSVPRQDRSQGLTRYPSDALSAPPQVLEVNAVFQLKSRS